MPKTVLITGATGTVGSAVARALVRRHVRPRVYVRDADKTGRLLGNDVDVVVGDLADTDALRHALRDVDALFLACGNVPDQGALECGVIDAAHDVRVPRVVKLSARGAAGDAGATYWRTHAAIEDHLARSGLASVVLRPSFLMTNLLAVADAVREHGVLPAPVGSAPIAMIAPADVAEVAARALVDDRVSPQVLTLAGPEAITYAQVAQRLSRVTARDVRFVDVTPEVAGQQMVATGVPAPMVAQVLEVFARLKHGDDATPGTTSLLGRAATTVDEFARQHAAAFTAREVMAP